MTTVTSASGFLPRLPFPEQRPNEIIDHSSLQSVKKALTRRGLDKTSIGLRGGQRLTHLNKRLQLALDCEEEARNETRLVRALRDFKISFVTPDIVGEERNVELARRLHARRDRDRVQGIAKAKMEAWNRISGDTSAKRLLSFKEHNIAKFNKLVNAALSKCDYPEIERLCKLGADSNHMTKGGHTALGQAATFNRAEFARVMVQTYKADPNRNDKTGHSPLTLASSFGHIRTVKTLIDVGADPNLESGVRKTPLMAAAEAGHEGTVQTLLQHGALINATTQNGSSPLLAACSAGREEMVHFLIQECNADMFATDADGYDVYHRAWADRQFNIKEWIRNRILKDDSLAFTTAGTYQERPLSSLGKRALEWKKKIKSPSRKGAPQLMPLSPDHESSTLSPIKKTVVTSKNATRGEKAMALAIAGNDFQAVIDIVRAKRAHVDLESYKTTKRETALMRASYYGRLEEIELLMALGADVNHHSSPSGATALISAASNNQVQAILSLLAWGAFINAQDARGWTAVMCAGREGHTNAVQTLIEHGASVRHQSQLGATAFIVAAANNQAGTASQLMGGDVHMREVEESVASLVRSEIANSSDGGARTNDMRDLMNRKPTMPKTKALPSSPLSVKDQDRRFDDMGMATSVSQQLNETMLLELEKLFEEEARRGRAKAKGRRKAVSVRGPELEERDKYIPGVADVKIGVRHGAQDRERDLTFTYSIQKAEQIVEEIKNELRLAHEEAMAIHRATEQASEKAEQLRILNRRGDEPDALEKDGFKTDDPECFKRPAELKLAAFYTQTKQLDKCKQLLNRLLAEQKARYGDTSIVLAGTHNAFGSLYARMSNSGKSSGDSNGIQLALAQHRYARQLLEHRHGPLHPHIVATDRLIVSLLTREGRYDEALDECEAVEKKRRKKVDRRHLLIVDVNKMVKAIHDRSTSLKNERERRMVEKQLKQNKKLASVAVQRSKENVHSEAYSIEGAEWFKNEFHTNEVFKAIFQSYCKKAESMPTVNLYWQLHQFRLLTPKTEEYHRELQFIINRQIRATRHAFLTRGMREQVFLRVEKINTVPDPTKIFDEVRVQAFIILHQQFKQFLRNVRGQRWLRGRIANRDGQTLRGVVPFQALTRRMIALGQLPERKRVAEPCSIALRDKFEVVMRHFHKYRTMATKIQSLHRGRKAREWFCGLVGSTFKEISNDGTHAFYIDTRNGTYMQSEPICIKRARMRFGPFWRR